jgi:hypothetical protein
VAVALPGPDSRWRCTRCGNLTRFDVVRTSRVNEYWHISMAGEPSIDESQTLAEELEQVSCRWCGASSAEGVIEIVSRADTPAEPTPQSTPDVV